jgi:hypothetical protein
MISVKKGRRMSRYSGYGSKTELDGLIWLDMKSLKRFGMLRGDVTQSLSWTSGFGDKNRVMMNVDIYNRRSRVWYTSTDQFTQEKTSHDYRIILNSTSCNYGGERWWFFCPVAGCAQRVRRLYMRNSIFACRACHNLCYSSQNENRHSMFYKLFDTYDKLEKIEDTITTPYYNGKPTRKMKRYLKLQQQAPSEVEYSHILEKMLDGDVI